MSDNMGWPTLAVILAAGQGTRMRSPLPKVLHPVGNRPLLGHVLAAVATAGIEQRAVVVGAGGGQVAEYLQQVAPTAQVFTQHEQLGTAHALLAARPALQAHEQGCVLVLFGDSPLITPQTLNRLRRALIDGAAVAVAGFHTRQPGPYGRLLVKDGRLRAIREAKDASPQELDINFCNGGVMGLRADTCLWLLERIGNRNAQGEYYLTDAVAVANEAGHTVTAVEVDEVDVLGVNDREQLQFAEQLYQQRRQRRIKECPMGDYQRLYIGGEWVLPVQRGVFETLDPSDESVLARVASATAEDIDLAVAAARRAFDEGDWPRWSGARRAQVLRNIAEGIRARQDELAAIEVRDNGKPLPEALWDIADTAGCFDFYAGLAEQSDQTNEQSIDLPDARFTSSVIKEPVGVVAAIIPWNFPMLMAAWKVAPALAAGCTLVLKPSELTPLTALELAGIADQAGLPAGVLNVVTGWGREAGAPLAEHPQVDKIAFTGSVPTGRKIMQAAASEIKNISLELGGKSPFVIFADSDIEAAVEWILFGIFWNQGQVCSATSRVLVERGLYPALLERLIAATEQIQIGQGFEEGVKLGPLVSQGQLDKVLAAIAAGQQEGARLVSGGVRPGHLEKGYYLTPAIFADVPQDSAVWREEIFGPVVCLRAFDTEAEAIRLANDSPFGLAAAVMSRDIPRCERVARGFRAGIVWVNCSQPTFVEAPWGGYKQSGIGRELGEWGYNSYLETKQITRYNGEPWGWYLK